MSFPIVVITCLVCLTLIIKALKNREARPNKNNTSSKVLYPNCKSVPGVLRTNDSWPPKRLATRLCFDSGQFVLVTTKNNGDVSVCIKGGVFKGNYLISRLENLDAIEPEDLVRFKI